MLGIMAPACTCPFLPVLARSCLLSVPACPRLLPLRLSVPAFCLLPVSDCTCACPCLLTPAPLPACSCLRLSPVSDCTCACPCLLTPAPLPACSCLRLSSVSDYTCACPCLLMPASAPSVPFPLVPACACHLFLIASALVLACLACSCRYVLPPPVPTC